MTANPPREQAIRQLVTKAVADSLAATKDDADEVQWATNLIAHLTSAMLDHLRTEGQPPQLDGPASGARDDASDSSSQSTGALVASLRQQLAEAQQERDTLAFRVQDIPDLQARAEAAEAQLAEAQRSLQLVEDQAGVVSWQTFQAIKIRAEAAEAVVASLRQLAQEWRDEAATIVKHADFADANLVTSQAEVGNAIADCAMDLTNALASLPTPAPTED
jgi:chromosome segregation ATPase